MWLTVLCLLSVVGITRLWHCTSSWRLLKAEGPDQQRFTVLLEERLPQRPARLPDGCTGFSKRQEYTSYTWSLLSQVCALFTLTTTEHTRMVVSGYTFKDISPHLTIVQLMFDQNQYDGLILTTQSIQIWQNGCQQFLKYSWLMSCFIFNMFRNMVFIVLIKNEKMNKIVAFYPFIAKWYLITRLFKNSW